MKKISTVFLLIFMILSLFACNKPNADGEADLQTDNQTSDSSTTIGYWEDDVDHFARDAYDVYYIHNSSMNLERLLFECFQNLESYLNVKVTDLTANSDIDLYLGLYSAAVSAGADGVICDMHYEYQARIMELLDEASIPYIGMFNHVYNDWEQQQQIAPTVAMNQHLNGAKQIEILLETYPEYWGDIDSSEIACLILTTSSNDDFITRQQGAEEMFQELYPRNPLFISDAMIFGNADTARGYELLRIFIEDHPDTKYLLVASVSQDYALSAEMAAVDFGRTDTILIASSGDMLFSEWDKGYDGNWVSTYVTYHYEYAIPAMCGLIAMMDGRVDKYTLWQELRIGDDLCTRYLADGRMVTRGNYKDMEQAVLDKYGIVEHIIAN